MVHIQGGDRHNPPIHDIMPKIMTPLLSIIATLTASYLADPAVPVMELVPVVAHIEIPEAIKLDIEAAMGWFAADVARPLLAARDLVQLQQLREERDAIAVQARAAIVNAAQALLQIDPHRFEAPLIDAEIRDQIQARFGLAAPALLHTLELASLDMADVVRFSQSHKISLASWQIQQAMAKLVPLATNAEIPLLVVLMAVHEHRETSPDVLAALVEEARIGVLRHRVALHAMLRNWDPEWAPTMQVPAWAEKPQALALNDTEIARIVELLRDPPAPTAALRRALSQG